MDQNNEPPKVIFETDSYQAVKFYHETAIPKIIQWTMKYSGGTIKDQRQAEYVLLGFVVLAIIISLFLFFGTSSTSTNKAGINQMMQLHPDLFKKIHSYDL